MGVNLKANQQQTKKKTTESVAEQRLQETFNTGEAAAADFGESAKRSRENYAIKLRKQKREEYFKEKRAMTQSTPNNSTPQASSIT